MALTVTVHSKEGTRYAQTITAGRYKLTADRTESSGGAGKGPGPYSFLLTALGT